MRAALLFAIAALIVTPAPVRSEIMWESSAPDAPKGQAGQDAFDKAAGVCLLATADAMKGTWTAREFDIDSMQLYGSCMTTMGYVPMSAHPKGEPA